MKTCSKCKVTQETSEFNKDSTRKDKLCNICKICKSIYNLNRKKNAKNLLAIHKINMDKMIDEFKRNKLCKYCQESNRKCLILSCFNDDTLKKMNDYYISNEEELFRDGVKNLIVICYNCSKKQSFNIGCFNG